MTVKITLNRDDVSIVAVQSILAEKQEIRLHIRITGNPDSYVWLETYRHMNDARVAARVIKSLLGAAGDMNAMLNMLDECCLISV